MTIKVVKNWISKALARRRRAFVVYFIPCLLDAIGDPLVVIDISGRKPVIIKEQRIVGDKTWVSFALFPFLAITAVFVECFGNEVSW